MTKRAVIPPSRVHEYLTNLFADDLHAKRVLSLADATVGALHAGAAGVHAIGRGLAAARGVVPKHAIKQVDRLFSNEGIDVWSLFPSWAAHALGNRQSVVINLDWTEFDKDDHSMLVLALQTEHGRTVPLLWQTFVKSDMADRRNAHEDRLLNRLREIIPANVNVTIVADRGFGDQKLYDLLEHQLGFDYIIRFRSVIHVTNTDGVTKSAREWIGESGRMQVLRNAQVTEDRYPVSTVVCVQDPGMKDAWCLVSSHRDVSGTDLKKCYGKRFSIEETFRDIKDLRYGMGMSWNRIGTAVRRDRMFLVAVLAQALLSLLGQAGEELGMDRLLKANTVKRRTLSLFRQGLLWYEQIPMMPETRLVPLMTKFGELITQHTVFPLALGLK